MRRLLQALKRLLLFCAGIILGYVAVCLLIGGAMLSTETHTWFSDYDARIFSPNLLVQGAVVALVASLCIGRAIIPLKRVQTSNGTTVSATEPATRGGGPVLLVYAILFLLTAFACYMIAQEAADNANRYPREEHNLREEQTARTFAVIWLVVGGTLLVSPLFLKRHVWQFGWRINAAAGAIAIGGVVLSGLSVFVWNYHGNLIKGSDRFYSVLSFLGVLTGTIITVLGGVKTVAGRRFLKQSWHEGANYPSPVQKVLVFDYYDGPTNGVLQCADGQAYCFDLLAWEPDTQDVRVFGLSPMPPKTWQQLSALCRGHGFPWPEQLRQSIEALLRQAGPVEWVLATEKLEGEILRAKAICPEELAQVTDGGAFLGLTQEVRDANPYLKPND